MTNVLHDIFYENRNPQMGICQLNYNNMTTFRIKTSDTPYPNSYKINPS